MPNAKSICRINEDHEVSNAKGTSLTETHVTSLTSVSLDHDQDPESNSGDDLVEGEQAVPSVDEELHPVESEP